MATIKTFNWIDGAGLVVKGSPPALREFSKDDIDTVVKLAKLAMPYPWSADVFEDCLKANYAGWVLTNSSENQGEMIIGFVVILIHSDECQLMNICIHPNYQRRGYANYVLEQVVEYSREKGASRIALEVRSSNKAAIELYQQAGFIEVGKRKQYYASEWGREDALIFIKNI